MTAFVRDVTNVHPSYPYIVGGNGWVFNTDFIVTF